MDAHGLSPQGQPAQPALITEEIRNPPLSELLLTEEGRSPDLSAWELADRLQPMLRDPETGRGPSVAACGRPTFAEDEVVVGWENGRVKVRQVARCKSPRCPVCAAASAMGRRDKVRRAIAAARAKGYRVGFVTLTAGHDADTRLADARKVMTESFSAAQRGAPWNRLCERVGIVGLVKQWEATAGAATGWHLHAHGLLFIKDDGDMAAAAEGVIGRWLAQLERRGWRAVRAAQDWQEVDSGEDDEAVAQYAEKVEGGLSAELAGDWTKTGRRPDRMSIRELATLAALGDVWAAHRWVEAVQALKGLTGMRYSKRLKELLGVTFDDPESDEELTEDLEPVEEPGLSVSADDWNNLALARGRGRALAAVKAELAASGDWSDAEAALEPHLEAARVIRRRFDERRRQKEAEQFREQQRRMDAARRERAAREAAVRAWRALSERIRRQVETYAVAMGQSVPVVASAGIEGWSAVFARGLTEGLSVSEAWVAADQAVPS